MSTYEIINILGNKCEIRGTKTKKLYFISFRIIELSFKLKIGDLIKFNNKLLNSEWEGYSDEYCFGSIDSIFGKGNFSENDIDLLQIKRNDKIIELKRLYG